MSKIRPLKRIKKCHTYILFDSMDTIIQKLKNAKIVRYWKKNLGLNYNEYARLPLLGPKMKFLEEHCDINNVYRVFYHCINMSLDNDVDEYINYLNSIK